MKHINFILILIAVVFSQSCNKCNDKPINDVRVRVQNDLDRDLTNVSIGSTMYKGTDSFASCSMTEGFSDVKEGQLTDYTITHGNHMGYDGIRVQWYDESRNAISPSTASNELIEAELLRNGAVEDSIANVYNGKVTYGLRLPDGDYTFHVLGLSPVNKNRIEIEITRD